MSDPNLHSGHRDRLRSRYQKQGLDGFDDHNVLELLLCYAIPRKDVNALAHQLIRRFGSLSAVFDAAPEELMTVEGIGERSATLIKLVIDLKTRQEHAVNAEQILCLSSLVNGKHMPLPVDYNIVIQTANDRHGLAF